MKYIVVMIGTAFLLAQLRETIAHPNSITVTPKYLISRSPSDAYRWAAYADSLASSKRIHETRAAIDRAVTLAPNTPQMLIRRINYCLETGDTDSILYDGKHVLQLTGAFDDIIFVYYRALNLTPDFVLQAGVPDEARALRSYIRNFAKFSEDDYAIFRTWKHIRDLDSIDPPTASDVANILVTRRRYMLASQIWRDFDPRRPADEAISNATFSRRPLPSPFDWSITPQEGMTFDLTDGLLATFEGTRNLSVSNVRQHFVAQPGALRLVIEYSSDAITTDQGPFFRLYEAATPSRFNLQTEMIQGTTSRRKLTLDFIAPSPAALLALQLERTASQKFDNKINGTLHLHRVSIRPLP